MNDTVQQFPALTHKCSTPHLPKISSMTLIKPPNDPKFRDFSYFYMTHLKSNFFLFFHSDFGCLEGGGGEPPPPPLNVYFQPRPK